MKKEEKKNFYHNFLFILMGLSLVIAFFLFRPFLLEIIIGAVIASVCFPLYKRLLKFLKNRKKISALIITLALLVLIIFPTIKLITYAAKQAPLALANFQETIDNLDLFGSDNLKKLNISAINEESVKKTLADLSIWFNNWLINAAQTLVIGTWSFIASLLIILLSVFYFLIEGSVIKKKILRYSPLPENYNLEIIKSFQDISRTTLLSLFICAIVQGLLSALGFLVIGWPFFLIFVISAFLSIIPYALTFFYLPIIIYFFATGQIWQGVLVTVWNLFAVVNIDELIRAYISKGKTNINMAFMLFSILGGIAIFGFAGIFVGPLVLTIAVTILKIYGREFASGLDRDL